MDKIVDDPAATIAYINSQGMPFENTIADVLLQIFTHGCYHRGQIALDLRQNGLEPVLTDYAGYLRTH